MDIIFECCNEGYNGLHYICDVYSIWILMQMTLLLYFNLLQNKQKNMIPIQSFRKLYSFNMFLVKVC